MTATITPIGRDGGAPPPPAPKPGPKKRRKQVLPKNRRSGGSAFDDLSLVLERVELLVRVLIERMDGGDENILLAHQIRMEIQDLEALASSHPTDWYAE
jgi:hypothetical protein